MKTLRDLLKLDFRKESPLQPKNELHTSDSTEPVNSPRVLNSPRVANSPRGNTLPRKESGIRSGLFGSKKEAIRTPGSLIIEYTEKLKETIQNEDNLVGAIKKLSEFHLDQLDAKLRFEAELLLAFFNEHYAKLLYKQILSADKMFFMDFTVIESLKSYEDKGRLLIKTLIDVPCYPDDKIPFTPKLKILKKENVELEMTSPRGNKNQLDRMVTDYYIEKIKVFIEKDFIPGLQGENIVEVYKHIEGTLVDIRRMGAEAEYAVATALKELLQSKKTDWKDFTIRTIHVKFLVAYFSGRYAEFVDNKVLLDKDFSAKDSDVFKAIDVLLGDEASYLLPLVNKKKCEEKEEKEENVGSEVNMSMQQ